MTRVLFGSLTALAVIVFTLSAQDKGKPKDDKPAVPKPETLAEQIARFDKFNRRGCGAKLSISKAELVRKNERWVVRVDWEIDYTGPRPPLTVFMPSMHIGPTNRTSLDFHYEVEKTGSVRRTSMSNLRAHGRLGPPSKEQFATVAKGKNSVWGVLDVDTANNEPTIPYKDWKRPFYVQLRHSPIERGDEFGFDAWTGQLVSNVIEVTEAK
jgi:hypothetical protein